MKLQSVNFERAVKLPWLEELQRSVVAENGVTLRANEGWVFVERGDICRCYPTSMVGAYGATPVKEAAPTLAKGQVRR